MRLIDFYAQGQGIYEENEKTYDILVVLRDLEKNEKILKEASVNQPIQNATHMQHGLQECLYQYIGS